MANKVYNTHSNDYDSDTKQQVSHSASQNCRKGESREGELTLYSHPHSFTLRLPTTHTNLTVGLSNPADNDTSDRSKFSLSGAKRENTLTILALFPGLQSPNAVEGLVKLLRRMTSGRRWVYIPVDVG